MIKEGLDNNLGHFDDGTELVCMELYL